MVLNVHRNHKAYYGRGEGGNGVWRLRKREIIYLLLHCHNQNDSCIKMGSDESHFNVSVGSDGESHKTVSTNHNLFEERRDRLTPYRWAKPAHAKEPDDKGLLKRTRSSHWEPPAVQQTCLVRSGMT